MARTIDSFITYRFIQILTTDWEDQDAFQHGIIDKDGKVLRRARTLRLIKEKDSYTIFHRLIFSLKRILEKTPFGRTKLGSFAAALFLIREDVTEDPDFYEMLYEHDLLDDELLTEAILKRGQYKLLNDILVGEALKGRKGDEILVKKDMRSSEKILGDDVFEVIHKKSKEKILVTNKDIEKIR